MKNRSENRLSDCNFRFQWISEAAYDLAERRHFAPGMELDDWLMAEHEFITMQILRYQTIVNEDGGMTIKGLQRLAQSLGVENPETMTLEAELIRSIQKVTETNPCFNSAPTEHCDDVGSCLWKADCKKIIATWHPLKTREFK